MAASFSLRIFAAILATLVAWAALTTSAHARMLSLVEDPWPPFTYGEAGEAPTGGYAVEFAEAVFERLDVPFEVTLYPWKRCLMMTKEGVSDGLLLLTRSEEREAWLAFTIPLMQSRDLVWYRADREEPVEWGTAADFSGYVIGRTAGFNYGDAFNQAEKEYVFTVDEAATDLLNFKKLAAGRIDAFICNEIAAQHLFKAHPEFMGVFAASAKPLKVVDLHMAFSKKTDAHELVPEIDRVIAELQAEGVFDRILGR